MSDDIRLVVCPFCGHVGTTTVIGSVFCGPHKIGKGKYLPAVRMREHPEPTI